MASLKEVRNRIVSVNSTQQITKAMKMVAAAKLRRAQDNILQMRPYAQKLGQMLSTVSAGSESSVDSPLKAVRAAERILIVVVTSDRGLCGAFNTNIIKATLALIEEKYSVQASKGNVEIFAIGKKGAEAFNRRGFTVNTSYTDLFTRLKFVNVKEAAEKIMKDFSEGRYDVVDLVYNEFKNVATQIIHTDPYLPIVADTATQKVKAPEVNYIFEPNEEEILAELIPKSLKIMLYRAVLESNASEQGARMTAMDKATENANELIKNLKISYNRARQAAITTELTEIVSGAAALQG